MQLLRSQSLGNIYDARLIPGGQVNRLRLQTRRKAKARGDPDSTIREPNAAFQKQARKDKYLCLNEECVKIECHRVTVHTNNIFKHIKQIIGQSSPGGIHELQLGKRSDRRAACERKMDGI